MIHGLRVDISITTITDLYWWEHRSSCWGLSPRSRITSFCQRCLPLLKFALSPLVGIYYQGIGKRDQGKSLPPSPLTPRPCCLAWLLPCLRFSLANLVRFN